MRVRYPAICYTTRYFVIKYNFFYRNTREINKMLWDHIKRQILAKTVLEALTVHSAHVASPGFR